MEGLSTIIIVFILIIARTCSSSPRLLENYSFNVVAYGAVGDGYTDDSTAFRKAWMDFCGASGDLPTLIVPAGKEFLLNSVSFTGPCKSPTLHFLLKGTLVAPSSISVWNNGDMESWIQFSYVTGLIINGGGKFDGRGQIWWDACRENESCKRPRALSFHQCNGLRMKSLYHVNSQRNHISLGGSTDVRMSNLTIVAPDDSPNTDGIDISHSSNVRIYDSFIGTGDDCIAINGFSSDINISRISCGPGHGISIGSLGKNGAYETVEDIRVTDSTFTRTQNCARIKTWKGGKGYVRRVTFERITLVEARNPIIIDQNYMSRLFVPTNPSSDVEISDVLYREVYGSTTYKEAIVFICGQQCSNIVVENVNITSATPEQQLMSVCENGSGIHSQFVIPKLTCLH